MAVAEVHPSAGELTAFTLGTLDDETQAFVEDHVATCTSCQERAATAPGDSFVELVRSVREAEPFVEPVAQGQTPAPLPALAETEVLAPASASSGPAEPGCPMAPDAIPPELAGHERYRIVRLLGVGGMGAVYVAEHRVMRRLVALKVINRACIGNAGALERFRGEVRAAARLSHPNIVTTYDAEDAGETHFLVMEYVEGTDLGRLVLERGRLTVDRACDYVRQAALGLQHAFEQGMVHRDLKPHNLMLTPDGRVKILDFGLAHFASDAAATAGRTASGIVLGTVDYIAPEQADSARQADVRSDIYSLGCTLYHLLAGQPPFPAGTSLQKVVAHVEKKPQPLTELRPDLPEKLMPVLERMMAKKPKHRYQTPAEVAFTLEPFLRATAVARPPRRRTPARTTDPGRTVVLDRIPGGERRRPRLALATAILAFFVAGLLGVSIYRIATDKGELVIETDNDDVEVVVSKGGEVVKIIDTRTGKHVTLNSGDYDLALKEGPKGLKLSRDTVTVKRGKRVVATITVVAPKEHQYLLLALDKVASAVSTKSLFTGADFERLIFPKWGKQEVLGIPFDVIDPKGDSVKNAIVLYGPEGSPAREMPKAVRLKCGSPAKAIHLLSGVAGWGYHGGDIKKTVCMIVRFHYQGGEIEDHELRNGEHFCDYNFIRDTNEVPGSRLAIRLEEPVAGGPAHIRYLAIEPKDPAKSIEEIEFIKAINDDTSPVVMAVTVEKPAPSAEKSAEKVGEIRRFEGHTKGAWGVAFSPDGLYALSGGSDGTCVLWEVATGREVRRFYGHDKPVEDVAFSPDGRQALTASIDKTVRLWDVQTGKEIRELKGHTDIVYRVAFSPDGRRALSGSADSTMRLWDLQSGNELRFFPLVAVGVACSPDGRRALSGGDNDPLVRLWDMETGAEVRHLSGHKGRVTDVVFLPGGRQALSCSYDRTLRLWDLDGGEEIRVFTGHTHEVQKVAISRDGRYALSASKDKTVRLWKLETGKELRCFTGHTAEVIGVAISPDGKFGLSGSWDNTVRLWRLPDQPPAKENP
jgi:WD40 repeat protein/anti-sigma factor RsiW